MSENPSSKSSKVQTDNADIRANNVAGGALVISNDKEQTTGDLVKVTGTAGKTALNVTAGGAKLSGGLLIGGSTTVISVVTATDASHTLTAANCGNVFITANLANGAVIKLPDATTETVGCYFRIIMVGTPADAAAIELPNGKTGELVGVAMLNAQKGQDGADERAIKVAAASDNFQGITIDPNDKVSGGAPGSIYEFYYSSTAVVLVNAHIHHTEDGTSAATSVFKTAGYA